MSTEQVFKNREFELRGVNHLAMVCNDMNRTIAFYRDVLGMPLLEDIELPDGTGHHFVFDIGKGALLTFFWFRSVPKGAPALATSPRRNRPDKTNRHESNTADSSMYHLAFDVPAEKLDEYLQRLESKGVPATIVNYDHSSRQHGEKVTENTVGRSIYFMDPDGIVLEFAT
jgi:catechol 2,3-dioxygenase-like lactoylglutathione lyase family enzyme